MSDYKIKIEEKVQWNIAEGCLDKREVEYIPIYIDRLAGDVILGRFQLMENAKGCIDAHAMNLNLQKSPVYVHYTPKGEQ